MIDIGGILLSWQAAGIFDYVLPFLLIFSFVFGILIKTELLGKENKGLNAIIALAIGALSLQLDFIPLIFRELFPRLGVGLAILLCLLILVGLFIKEQQKTWNIIFSVIGAVILIVIVIQSFDMFGWGGFGFFGGDVVGWVVGAILLIGVIVAVVMTTSSKP
ncbi:MAG: hypothetical protein AABX11_03760 [Nanoarchaeota archaeon]